MKVNSSLLVCMMVGFLGCSGGQKLTAAKFNLYLGAMTNSLDHQMYRGGVILFAKSLDLENVSFSERITPSVSGDVAINLPNGLWNFYVMGWSGVVNGSVVGDMQGTVYCALSVNRQLGGQPVEIQLTMSNSGCANPEFTAQHFLGADKLIHFPQLKFTSCNDLADVSFDSTRATINSCAPLKAGMARSYRVKVLSLRSQPKLEEIFPRLGGDLVSPCLNVSSVTPGATELAQLLNIPDGNGILPFPTIVEAYLGADCQNIAQVAAFERGLESFTLRPINNVLYLKSTAGVPAAVPVREIFFQVTPQQVCANADPNRSTFPIGDGIIFPYGICDVQDLERISDHLDKKFLLLRNIDIDERYAAGQFAMERIPCSEDDGMNLMPIGRLQEEVGGVCIAVDAGYDFIGEFDGAGLAISNLRIFSRSSEGVGFFRRLGAGAKVKNLRFLNSEVSGNRRLGILAGEMVNDDSIKTSLVENVSIEKGVVRRDGWDEGSTPEPSLVGGLIGAVEGSGTNLITGVRINQLALNGNGRDFGGIVGGSTGHLQLLRSSVEGEIRMYNKAQNIGGILGNASEQTLVGQCYSEGSLQVNGMESFNHGGLVGSNSGIIRNSASRMILASSNASANGGNVGGIVGYHAGLNSNIVEKNLFYGLLLSNCATNCQLGEIAGGGPGNFSYNNFAIHNNAFAGAAGWMGERGVEIPLISATSISYFTNNIKVPLGDTAFNTTTGIWKMVEGYSPVPSYFEQECLNANNLMSVALQVTTGGRGLSAANPIVICNAGQFAEIGNYANRFFRLASSLPKIDFTNASAIANFTGSFDGQNKILAGMDSTVSLTGSFGIFRTIGATGVVKNVRLLGHRLNIQGTSANFGILAGVNNGTIQNVVIGSSNLVGQATTSNCGQLAGTNSSTGKIISSTVMDGLVSGGSTIGVAVGLNQGSIRLTVGQGQADGPFEGTVTMLGGLVGKNDTSGIISRSTSSSYISLLYGGSLIGGLAGQNLGKIEDSYTSSQQQTRLMAYSNPSYQQIGGLVGVNDGVSAVINRSYAGGKVWIDGSVSSLSNFGGLVGQQVQGATAVGQAFFAVPPLLYIQYPPALYYEKVDANSVSHCQDLSSGSVRLAGFSGLLSDNNVVAGGYVSPNEEMRDLVLTINNKTDTELTLTGASCEQINNYGDQYASLLQLRIFNVFSGANTIGKLSAPVLAQQYSYYCQDTLPTAGSALARDFQCTNGWDIASMDGEYGLNRLYAFYEAQSKGLPLPANMPIWEMKDGEDGLPRLLGIDYN